MATYTENDKLAFKLLTLGYSVIPSGGGNKGKSPLVDWIPFQLHIPTEAQFDGFINKRPHLWGIVTGQVSGVDVLDVDTEAERNKLQAEGLTCHVVSPRQGGHFYFPHKVGIGNKAGILPGIDVRGQGGFANIIGKHANGEYKILCLPQLDSLNSWDKVPERIRQALDYKEPVERKTTGGKIPSGERNDRLFRLASGMRRQGASEDTIFEAIKEYYENDCEHDPEMTDDELRTIAKQAGKYKPVGVVPSNISTGYKKEKNTYASGGTIGGYKSFQNAEAKTLENVRIRENLSAEIKEWVIETGGSWFTTLDLDSDLGIRNEKDKANRRFILHDLRGKGFLEKHNLVSGKFRYIDAYAEKIDILGADNKPLDIRLPFELHKLVKMFPKTLIVCAGAADSGKTALALNACALNLGKIEIRYLSSEMGGSELRDRLSLFGSPSLEQFAAGIDFRERSADFADLIKPDALNVVDYLTLTEDFYKVNGHLIKFHEKIRNGIVLALIQKNRGAELGTGGNKGLERPRLYFTMDSGRLKIEKAKNWVDSSVNPNNKEFKYKLVKGCKFIIEGDIPI